MAVSYERRTPEGGGRPFMWGGTAVFRSANIYGMEIIMNAGWGSLFTQEESPVLDGERKHHKAKAVSLFRGSSRCEGLT